MSDGSLIGAPVSISGIGLNFAQDSDFDCDDNSNTLYGTFFDENTFLGKFGTLDPVTGVFTEIRTLTSQISGFSVDNVSCNVEAKELPAFAPSMLIGFSLLVLSLSVVFMLYRIKL